MIYTKKLLISKILVSLGLCVFVLVPLTLSLEANQMLSGQYGHSLALPIMLWAIWGKKLHGTGRSVRLMAYLGLAFTVGFYMADSAYANMVLAMDSHVVFTWLVFILLLLGIFISIRRGSAT